MKHYLAIFLLIVCIPWVLGADVLYVVNSQSRTLSRIDLSQNTVNNTFAILGNVPNRIVVSDNHLWSVASGDNAIQKISPTTGQTLANYLVDVSSNPWDAIYHDNYLYITGLMSGKVYKMDANTGSVVGSLSVGTAPEALAIHAGKLYVTKVGNYVDNYAGSSVSVIDLASFTQIKNLALPVNPQYLRVHNDQLHISCTGNWMDLTGKICILDTATDEITNTLDLGGSPGNIFINNDGIAYVADAGGYALYRYNANTLELLNPAANALNFAAGDVIGSTGFLALVSPNWGYNGVVQILDWELNAGQSFTVGMMPTDIKLQAAPTSVSDATNSPVVNPISLYPSPLRSGESLQIKSRSHEAGEFTLYNVRGQKVHSERIMPETEKSLALKLKSGVYFYRFESGKGQVSKKLIVL